MASPQIYQKDLKRMITDTKQDMDDVHVALEKLRSLSQDDKTEAVVLRSRIDEQSGLISVLKQRADEMLLRCQALERINAELESLREDVQTELENERMRSSQLEQRFLELAANHQELVSFKDEYKTPNVERTDENKRLPEENEKVFCEELQEKEAIVLKLTQELKDLAEQHKRLETEYQEKTTGFQTKLKELISLHQTKEASLQDELYSTQKQLKDAVEMYTELDLQLRQTIERETKEIHHQEIYSTKDKERNSLTGETETETGGRQV